jgi:hypothetical protein
MTAPKTRCEQCVQADKRATQEPCSQCSEIYPSLRKFENQFLEAKKNLMKED